MQTLTLLPRPLYPYEIWQPVTSPPTLEVVPKWGHNAVFWLQNHQFIARSWERYGEIYAEEHGTELDPHENRMLVLSVRVADTHEHAVESSRAGHDEFWKLLGPYGWSRGYAGSNGKPVGPGLIPSLEESMENKTWIVGTAEGVAFYQDTLGADYITLFPQFAGDPYGVVEDQLHRFREEVVPLL